MHARFPNPAAKFGSRLRRQRMDLDEDLVDESERIVITVEDDGPGIPPHALERIFERFYTDRPNQGFGQNSGLGLSISRQIVEAHGGRIWAENRPLRRAPPPRRALAADVHAETARSIRNRRRAHGAGARFVISLPAATP